MTIRDPEYTDRLLDALRSAEIDPFARARVRARLDGAASARRPRHRLRLAPVALLILLFSSVASAMWAGETIVKTVAEVQAWLTGTEPRTRTRARTGTKIAVPETATATETTATEAAPQTATQTETETETETETATETAAQAPPPASTRRPAPSRPIPSTDASLVATAMTALRHDANPDRALSLVDRYLSAHPDGELAEEALALRIEALIALDDPRARAAARDYLDRHPEGRFRALAERVTKNP